MKARISGPINLEGKVAVVTGGARGIGQAICISLAREGSRVAVTDVLPADETVARIQEQGQKALGLRCDVSQKEDVTEVVRKTVKKFGTIDILVNNAGILGEADINTPLLDYSVEEWDRVHRINLRGTFLFCQAVWPVMEKQRSGKIVCLGSIGGKIGGIVSGVHYCTSKGGVHTLVKYLAKKGPPSGIYVNAVAPAAIFTPMLADQPIDIGTVPLGRRGQPEDVAEPVVFLASSASNFITGTILDINGELLMD